MIKNIFCSFFCLAGLTAVAQQPMPADYDHYHELYSKENAVFLQKEQNNVISYDNNELKITRDENEEILLLGNNVNMYSERTVDYSGFDELLSLDAKTQIPVKNSYKTLAASNIVTQKSTDDYVFYDDSWEKKVFFSGLQKGAKIDLNYKMNIKNPRLLTPFYFAGFDPSVESVCTYTCPNSLHLEYKLFNIDDKSVEFTRQQKGSNTVYTWRMKNVRKYDVESQAPNPRYYFPHLIVYVADYTIKDKTTHMLSSVDDLYHWYYDFIHNINTDKPSPALTHIVDSLTAHENTEVEKVKSIYYWVQDHIKYVAFEDGLQGFIPRQGDTVCERRYGDCKDMASIITRMMHYAKINCYLTWVGTDDIPYTYEEVPVPLNNNHMIATYIENGNYHFLDGTGQYLAYGRPSSFIQGKEVLIALDSLNYKVVLVPEVPAAMNTISDSAVIDVGGDEVKGTGIETIAGYARQRFKYSYADTKADDVHKLLEGYTSKGNNKYKLDTAWIVNNNDPDAPVSINYSFNIPSYMNKSNNEIFINLNLSKEFYNDVIDTSIIKLDTKRDYKYSVVETYTLPYPAGYSLEHKPSDYSYTNDKFSFTAHYDAEGNKLVLHKEIIINSRFMKATDYSAWNDMVHQLGKLYSEVAILKKN